MFENIAKYLSDSVLQLRPSLSSHTRAGCGAEAPRPPLKGAAAARSELSSFTPGQQENSDAGLTQSPIHTACCACPRPNAELVLRARTSAVPPTGNSSQQRDRAAASQVSAATVSAESEIRSWGLYRNVPKLFTGPSASPSALVRVKGNVLEGTSYPWFPGPLT